MHRVKRITLSSVQPRFAKYNEPYAMSFRKNFANIPTPMEKQMLISEEVIPQPLLL